MLRKLTDHSIHSVLGSDKVLAQHKEHSDRIIRTHLLVGNLTMCDSCTWQIQQIMVCSVQRNAVTTRLFMSKWIFPWTHGFLGDASLHRDWILAIVFKSCIANPCRHHLACSKGQKTEQKHLPQSSLHLSLQWSAQSKSVVAKCQNKKTCMDLSARCTLHGQCIVGE